MQEYQFRVRIINPCERYFSSITNRRKVNDKLIDDCNEAFGRVADCPATWLKDADSDENDVQTGPMDEVGGFLNTITNTLGIPTTFQNQTKVSPINVRKGS